MSGLLPPIQYHWVTDQPGMAAKRPGDGTVQFAPEQIRWLAVSTMGHILGMSPAARRVAGHRSPVQYPRLLRLGLWGRRSHLLFWRQASRSPTLRRSIAQVPSPAL